MRLRNLGAALALTTALASSGCYHARYTSTRPAGATHSETGHFFLWGLVGHKQVNTEGTCPGGLASAHVYRTFLNGFLGALTAGLYSPATVEYTCAAGGPTASAEEVQ